MADVLKFPVTDEDRDWRILEATRRANPTIPMSPMPISVASRLAGRDDGADLIWRKHELEGEGKIGWESDRAALEIDAVVRLIQGCLNCTPFRK